MKSKRIIGVAVGLVLAVGLAACGSSEKTADKATGDKAAAAKTLQESQAVMDKMADKKIVHKNMVSRTKSRLSTAIKALA